MLCSVPSMTEQIKLYKDSSYILFLWALNLSSASVSELVPGVPHHVAPPPGLDPHVAVAADHPKPPPVQILNRQTEIIKHEN